MGLFAALLGASLSMSAALAADTASKDQDRAKEIRTGKPSATLDLEAKQFRLILGGDKGKGVLHYKGKNYPFTLKGVAVGVAGYTEVAATGRVYFLNKLEDFPGTYGAASIDAALGEGAGGSSWQNQKEVVLILKSKEKGVALNLGFSAMEIEFAK